MWWASATPIKQTLAFTAPLTATTAPVTGVGLELALFFAYCVRWPSGFGGPIDAFAVLVALVALVALFKFKRGVIEVIPGCAAVDIVLQLARAT